MPDAPKLALQEVAAAPALETSSASVDPIAVRRSILDIVYRAKASHLGTSMSAVEALIAIYSSVEVGRIAANRPDRSRVIVSKGHCAAATYSVLHHFGLMERAVLETYHSDGSLLSGHVSHAVEHVEHSTGALGHGLPVACGCAVGLRSRGYDESYVFTLLGDGELQEGAVWEALMFASHHNLKNLITLIDNNRISSITRTADVLDLNPMRAHFEGFGFVVHEVDGHDVSAILDAIQSLKRGNRVGVIVCNTVKGKDVPFAENQPIWHYRTLSEPDYKMAVAHLDLLERERRK